MAKTKTPKPFLDFSRPVAIAHRGYSTEGLENSVAAFKAAVELGYNYLETDINTTEDGVAMVFHDATLDRTTDMRGAIAALPYSEVRTARIAGREPIATLEELVTALPGVRFNIDVKDAGSVAPLIAAIEKHRLHDRICVASFSDKRRRAVLAGLSSPVASSPGKTLLVTYFLLQAWLPAPLLRFLMRGVDVLQIPVRHQGMELATAAKVRRAHALGLKVHIWTIDDPAEMNRLFDLGVDGIMTDRADLLAEVMHQRGYWT